MLYVSFYTSTCVYTCTCTLTSPVSIQAIILLNTCVAQGTLLVKIAAASAGIQINNTRHMSTSENIYIEH